MIPRALSFIKNDNVIGRWPAMLYRLISEVMHILYELLYGFTPFRLFPARCL